MGLAAEVNAESTDRTPLAPEAGTVNSGISGTFRDWQAQEEWELLGKAGKGLDNFSGATLSVRPIETNGLKFRSNRSIDEWMDFTR